jgi:hypothetical protein
VNRRLWLLNILLLVLIGACAYLLRERWREAENRRREILATRTHVAVPALAEPSRTPETPVRAASYFEVAEKTLFSKDRNPTVVVEVEQAKPMPPLPSVYGVLDIGQGPVAFLAMKGEAQRGYKLGEAIGEFKLRAANQTEIEFEWDGKPVKRRLDELRGEVRESAAADNARPEASRATAPAASASSAPPAPREAVNPNANANVSSNATPYGVEVSATMRACQPNDPTPAGTVVNGYRKVIAQGPVGKSCFWEIEK